MLLSQLIGKRTKEVPVDATLASHAILLRGGYIRQVANGIYSLLPIAVKVVKKIENIIREEMDRIGGQEVLMPVVLPRELWDESGRYVSVGLELLRFSDRTDHEMLLAMTHEEAVVHLVRNEARSYRSYPFMVYQMQTKFRDEPRSRGGLVRVREFTMKDAYSFHRDNKSLQEFYEQCADTYDRIFSRVGIPEVKKVLGDSGIMGGRISHEFMLLTESGEDTIVTCQKCDYISNLEVAQCNQTAENTPPEQLTKVSTPGKKTIQEISDFLGVPPHKTAKVVFYKEDSSGIPVMVLIRGDLEVNELKLAKIIGVQPLAADETTMLKTGAVPGYASPVGIHNCRIIADQSVELAANLIAGANEPDYHYVNFNLKRDSGNYEIADIAFVREGDCCPECASTLTFRRGIEVGNIFQLGTKYTEKMVMRYLDENGNECTPIMGCYGIGIGRLMASVIEARHDSYGPVWPLSIAPFTVHIIAINLKTDQRKQFSDPIYQQLCSMGIEVIYDDREERPGVQFADADLIGAPLRLLFSSKNIDSGMVEWKMRDGSEKGVIQREQVVEMVRNVVGGSKHS
jgi:prolyl-tRNA synthetase